MPLHFRHGSHSSTTIPCNSVNCPWGSTPTPAFLETIVVVASNGDELLIHAKKARSKCVDLLTWKRVAVLFMVFSLPCQMSSTETRSWCGEQVERAHDQKDLSLNSCQGSDRRKNSGGGDAGYGREMPTDSE